MTTMNLAKLKADLVRDEGLRLKPYRCTAGKLSIGVGRNLDDVGISKAEAMAMLDADLEWVRDDLDRNCPWWRRMPEPAQRALANMLFNLGWSRLSAFRNMLAALQAGDYEAAAEECLDSKWATQVGDRSRRIVNLYLEAANPEAGK